MKVNIKKIIAVIPARGGSKRIPKKNIKFFAGKPLIAYTIKAAQENYFISRVIVSTDNKEIAKVAKKYGAETINRPSKFATDKAETRDVVLHVIKILEKERYNPDVIVLLQPTSPLRTGEDINKAIGDFLKEDCEAVISVCKADPVFHWASVIEKKYLKPVFSFKKLEARGKKISDFYIPNGAIYIFTPKSLKKYQSIYPKKIIPYVMPTEGGIDIDTEFNFNLAELIMKRIIEHRLVL